MNQLSREKISGKWDCFIVSKSIMIYVESCFSCRGSVFNSMNTIQKKKKNIFQYESQWKISLSKKFKIGYYKYARND
jgi:hypothetical protein